MTRNRLYITIVSVCTIAYVWLFWVYNKNEVREKHHVTLCAFKQVTGVPCPSCGATRSIVLFAHGDISGALQKNPLGLLMVLVLVVAPLWLLADLWRKRDSLLRFYLRFEIFIRRKQYAIPAIALLLSNWVWNIYKGV